MGTRLGRCKCLFYMYIRAMCLLASELTQDPPKIAVKVFSVRSSLVVLSRGSQGAGVPTLGYPII